MPNVDTFDFVKAVHMISVKTKPVIYFRILDLPLAKQVIRPGSLTGRPETVNWRTCRLARW